jgi:hypothetical protein
MNSQIELSDTDASRSLRALNKPSSPATASSVSSSTESHPPPPRTITRIQSDDDMGIVGDKLTIHTEDNAHSPESTVIVTSVAVQEQAIGESAAAPAAAPGPGPESDDSAVTVPLHPEPFKLENKRYSYDDENYRSKDPGDWFWLVIILIPSLFVVLVYGVLPVGEPDTNTFSDFAVFTFLTTPITYVAIVYVMLVAFLALSSVDRPFRVCLTPLVAVGLSVAVASNFTWSVFDSTNLPPSFFGVIMLLIAAIVTLISMCPYLVLLFCVYFILLSMLCPLQLHPQIQI